MLDRTTLITAYRMLNQLHKLLREKHREVLPGEYIVLAMLEKEKSLRCTDLANDLNIGFSMLSRYVATLEKEGLATRDFGKEDKREVIFTITAQGKKKLAAIEKDLQGKG